MNRKLPVFEKPRWWKGNLHMHSFWSDGADFPEMIADWYRNHGYNFIAFTEHNRIQENCTMHEEGPFLIDTEGAGWQRQLIKKADLLEKYKERFGSSWVEETRMGERSCVRLKPLSEYRSLLEEAGRFIILQGEEINVSGLGVTHWMNATGIPCAVPQGGSPYIRSSEAMKSMCRSIKKLSQSAGRKIVLHLNHPNFEWNATAEDIAAASELKFMEIHTALNCTYSYGDELHAGAERIWDIVLAKRLNKKEPILYGLATDDAHQYADAEPWHKTAMGGRAWIMVRSGALTQDALLGAMERGDFYCSTGVTLEDLSFDGETVSLKIQAEKGVKYRTHFIGTLKGFDDSSTPVVDAGGKEVSTTRRYGPDIGKVLAESDSGAPEYTLKGDELYVRALVLSDRPHPNPTIEGDVEKAWTQPFVSDCSVSE